MCEMGVTPLEVSLFVECVSEDFGDRGGHSDSVIHLLRRVFGPMHAGTRLPAIIRHEGAKRIVGQRGRTRRPSDSRRDDGAADISK